MSRWAIYLVSTGQIERVFDGPGEFVALNLSTGEAALELPLDLTDTDAFVLNDQVFEKQPFAFIIDKSQITANGTDEALITNIPAGTTVTWPDGQTDVVTDGEVRFSVDLMGTYTLTFTAIPYLDQEVVIEAVAPA